MLPPPPGGGGVQRGLTRGKTLTRPDRFVAPAPLINPHGAKGASYSAADSTTDRSWDWWGWCVAIITWWGPRWLLNAFGLPEGKHRAWKEKCALCSIALFMMGIVGFLTIGLTKVLCPTKASNLTGNFIRLGTTSGLVGIQGWNFNTTTTTPAKYLAEGIKLGGVDISDDFDQSSRKYPHCTNATAAYVTTNLCTAANSTTCLLAAPTATLFTTLGLINTTYQVGYSWDQVGNLTNHMVINGNVLNLTPYMLAHPNAIARDPVDTAIRYVLNTLVATGGKDGTRLFTNRDDLKAAVACLTSRYYAGHIDKVSPGCFISNLFLYCSLALITIIILVRFLMAIIFAWILSSQLVRPPKNLKRKAISPAVMPEGANIDISNTTGAAPWINDQQKRRAAAGQLAPGADGMISMASIGAELFCVCLVTCYSEGEEGIRTTLDSIAGTTYSDARKLIFVVCDGMITGHGEKKSTPDICVGLIEADPRFGEPIPMSYVAIADGSKKHNQAMVYAGHYTNVRGHRTPTVIVVKCGPPEEKGDNKPGNRGKRDSQMVLMNFFSRVTYNDRMTPLDYDLFRKTQSLMGVTPDFFELCLMVDADTMVYPESMSYLVRAMQHDSMVMGVCGETRIGNKRQSWVTMIQVFEYFISHHQAKAFEAVFGGVTCLPGCFSMYRIKARKPNEDDWFPVLVQPQIVSQYSQTNVTTLHQKNLLLLGEDRFLTTLLLRTFPNRKMSFCPQARCRTVAPDTFAVLLSQRRRWINSTVHNLMELVLVRNLCGTFCFSMQFVVFIDLIGTIVLPIAICLTLTTAISYIFTPPTSFSDAIPLLLLGLVLGLPAVLILLTTMKIVYVGWMLIYLCALPIWNFVLPVYSFMKFDDFSWGETRKVEGEVKGQDGHDGDNGIATAVTLRRWEDWERSRLRKIKRDEKRRREFERAFGNRFHGESGTGTGESSPDGLRAGGGGYAESQSDSTSIMSGDDSWGRQVGEYREDSTSEMPPPVGLYHIEDDLETITGEDMELVLAQEWDDSSPRSPGGGQQRHYDGLVQSSPAQPPRAFNLNDPPMAQPWGNHGPASAALLSNSSHSSINSYGNAELASPRHTPPGGHPLAGILPSADSTPSPAQSSAYERPHAGHAKQRSLSGGHPRVDFGGDRGRTPSPTMQGWSGGDQPYANQGPSSQGRRLA
ncbi:hypothetical protein RQP46_010080 [Phenoliferia psychrophenolica]